MNTIECPCCGRSVEYPEGADEILCPHCGELLESIDDPFLPDPLPRHERHNVRSDEAERYAGRNDGRRREGGW